MAKQPEEVSLSQLLAQASSDLAQVAVKPNMFLYKPHEKQCLFHGSMLREKLFIGGNRSGKTVANIMECVWWLTKKHPFRQDVNRIVEPIRGRLVCVSFVDGLEKIILPYFKQFLPGSELINGSWDESYNKYLRTLTLANGSFIEFMSYDQELEKFAGTSRHFISFDEEPPQAIFFECRMRLIDTKGSWWVSMTPVEGMSWVYDVIYEPASKGERPQSFVVEIISTENPHLDAAEVDMAMEGMSAGDKQARKEGKFVELGGVVFPEFNNRTHVIEKSDFQLTRNMLVYTSFDHGWRHPAAWLWHAVEPTGRITTFHEIIVTDHTVQMLVEKVNAFEREFLKPLGHTVYMRPADPATAQTSAINGMSIMQTYAVQGIYLATENIPKGPNSVAVGLDKMHQYLKVNKQVGTAMWRITKNCEILIEQMKKLKWEKYSSRKMDYENAPKTTIHKKNDDGPDSARYFFTLMQDLYHAKTKEELPIQNLLGAVQYGTPWNNVAGFHDEMLPDVKNDYTVYEGTDLYALENY